MKKKKKKKKKKNKNSQETVIEVQSAEEMRVIETDDGEKWVNIEDLLISYDFLNHLYKESIDNQINQTSDDVEKVFLFNSANMYEKTVEILSAPLHNIIKK